MTSSENQGFLLASHQCPTRESAHQAIKGILSKAPTPNSIHITASSRNLNPEANPTSYSSPTIRTTLFPAETPPSLFFLCASATRPLRYTSAATVAL